MHLYICYLHVYIYVCIHEWMDGRMDGWSWMDGHATEVAESMSQASVLCF